MVMVKPQLRVKQNCLPSIISNVTNNKKFSKTTIAIRFNILQVYPSVPLFIFTGLLLPSFKFLGGYFHVSLNLEAFATFRFLINLVAQLLFRR